MRLSSHHKLLLEARSSECTSEKHRHVCIVDKEFGALKLVIFIFKYFKVASFIYVITSTDVFI